MLTSWLEMPRDRTKGREVPKAEFATQKHVCYSFLVSLICRE